MTNSINVISTLDPVQGLVDYCLDVKPYHTKIVEILIEYIYSDTVNVSIEDILKLDICMAYPFSSTSCGSSDPANDILYCSGFGNSSFGSTGVIPVYSPDPTKTIEQYQAFNPISKTYTIPGDQLGLFPIGSKFMVYAMRVDTITGSILGADIHYGVYTTQSASFKPGKIPTRAVSTDGSTLDFGINPHTEVTVVEDNFTISQLSSSQIFQVSGDQTQYFPTGSQIGITSVNNPLHNTSTVANAVYISVGDYTDVTINAGFISPLAGDTVTVPLRTLPVNESYVLYLVPVSLPIENILPYSIPTPETPDESAYLNIGSNAFVIDGNHVALFRQGTRFEVFNSSGNNRIFTTLYSDYVSGKTRIRPMEGIQSLTVDGMIKPYHAEGFSTASDFCAQVPDTTVLVKIDENLIFVGSDMNFTDQVVVYDMENQDVQGFELPFGTIVSNTTPPIALIEPVAPGTFDLWFDGLQLFRRDGGHWTPIQHVFWIKTDTAGRYIELYRLTKTLLVDTGWELQSFESINGIILALSSSMTPFGTGFFGGSNGNNPIGPLQIDISETLNDIISSSTNDILSISNEVILSPDGSLNNNLAATSITDTLSFEWAGAVDWFQYNIVFMDSTLQEIIVYGNALSDVMLGDKVRVMSNTGNSGTYTITGSPTYDPITHKTTIPTSGITIDSFGGVIESYEDFGMHLRFNDIIGVQTFEEATAVLPVTGLSVVGSLDAGPFGIGGLDETLDTIIPLYKA